MDPELLLKEATIENSLLKLSDKLDFRKLGSFKILKKISEVNYKLKLPKNIRLKTAVFYILLLKKALVDKEIGELIMDEIIKQENGNILQDGKDTTLAKTLGSQKENSRGTPRRFCGNFTNQSTALTDWDGPAAAELGANKAAWRAASASSCLTQSNSSKSVIPRATARLIFLYHNFFCLQRHLTLASAQRRSSLAFLNPTSEIDYFNKKEEHQEPSTNPSNPVNRLIILKRLVQGIIIQHTNNL
ncbi:hypothetical protein MKX08_009568 [Trichoderma sp. CBMAI-0020]|nr:hypothetical protein MKX08_009568 [Trichoderma sp. CBMAI-0020]